MMFGLERDEGNLVSLYFVADGFASVPKIVAHSGGRALLSLTANEFRQVLVDAGRHENGQCGFRIDEQILPGLSGMEDLEIYDADTALLLYRRPGPHYLAKKILRVETHLFPLWRLDDTLQHRFQYFRRGIDALGMETTTQLFLLSQIKSVYLSGRILFNNYRFYVENGNFQTIFIMHDPFDEMAERLLMLAQINRLSGEILGSRDRMGLQSTIEFAQSLSLNNEQALRKALNQIPGDVAFALANPIVRQLTASTPDEAPRNSGLSTTLEILSSFTVVGLRNESDFVRAAVAELTEVDPAILPDLERLRSIASLAQSLRRSRTIEALLEQDLEIYNHIATAYEKSVSAPVVSAGEV